MNKFFIVLTIVTAQLALAATTTPPAITHPGLDLAGPIKATVRLRATAGGEFSLAWRTKEQPDFSPDQIWRATATASPEWQLVTLEAPARGTVIHVRLHVPGNAAVEISRIELLGSNTAPRTWDFSISPKSP